ncbi:MAG: hypothetical protein GY820_46745 [Gammaproteobacteria bacterium]|nr:hypothetical protein [Gammaproteobacteria bacterium]
MEELYIRNVISFSENELDFTLTFDLHGFDCGAPDCYSTDLNFRIPHNNQLIFPNELKYSIHEHGCVESEFRTSGTMTLVEQGDSYVNYYSEEQRSNLVIIGNDERKEYTYLFTETEPNFIRVSQLKELIDSYPVDGPGEIPQPFMSTDLLRYEYQNFF